MELQNVLLANQFRPENVTVGTPMFLRNPVDKLDDGLPIYDNDNHLACYKIQPQYALQLPVVAVDQFTPLYPPGIEFIVSLNQCLCVPSSKKIKPSEGCAQ